MANGSLRNFVYTTDSGDEFVYKADESWTEEVIAEGGALPNSANFGPLSTAKYDCPRNIKKRSVVAVSDSGNRRIIIVCPTRDIFDGIDIGAVFNVADAANPSDQNLRVRFKNGERLILPQVNDTGLDDGDNP